MIHSSRRFLSSGWVAAERAEVLLRMIDVGPCSTNCQFDCGNGSQHQNWDHLGGNDGGEKHSCAFSMNGCGDHTCNGEVTSARELQELDALLPRVDGARLLRLEQRQRAVLSINQVRRAVQVLGCDGKVILSLGLTEGQIEEYVQAVAKGV